MMNHMFERLDALIKGVIYFCLLAVGAIVAVFLLYFCLMSIARLWDVCWDLIFSHDWDMENVWRTLRLY